MYHYNEPMVSYANQDREAIAKNKLLEEQNKQLAEQNKTLQRLANEASKSSASAERSAKISKKCTIISLVVAVLMFVITAFGIGFDIWSTLREEPVSQQSTQLSLVDLSK